MSDLQYDKNADRIPPSLVETPSPDILPLSHRLANLCAIILPFVGLVVAMVWVWGRGFHWLELGLLVGMYALTGFGVTIGFHRFFTHRSFETSRVMQVILAILGSMAVEGPMLHWVATHRCHHQHSDREADPHSPHLHGTGMVNMARGLWRAHCGWIFEPTTAGLSRYVGDFRDDRLIRAISRLFPLWVVVSLLLPTLIGGLISWSWTGALLGLVWGGLVRIFCVHHATWSVNSVCHIWGGRPYESHDQSRNNPVFGILALGEGWHNNHHAFPTSARHGLEWWQIDFSYLLIRLMDGLGLVWKVRVPTQDRLMAKRR